MTHLDAHRRLGLLHQKIRKDTLSSEKLSSYKTDIDLAKAVERAVLLAGFRPAFPCTVSVDKCVAHWTPSQDKTQQLDFDTQLVKVDFGIIDKDGHIVDAACSVSNDPKNQELIAISEEATSIAVGMAGADASIEDMGEAIQEYMESKEIDGKQVKSVWDVCGHQIQRFQIHGRKVIPNIKFDLPTHMRRMCEDEVYAIEPFPTLGKTGDVVYRHDINQMWMFNYRRHDPSEIPQELRKFNTLPFCNRWGVHTTPPKCYNAMPPIHSDGVTAHTEHNIYIRPERAELLT
jgi:methionyl aminopeptidase